MSKKEIDLWLKRAESNFSIGLTIKKKNILLEDLCFEFQQAAEKALKALLIYYGEEVPYTHSFVVILDKLKKHIEIPEKIKEVTDLTDYAVQCRYPGDYLSVNEKEYLSALKITKNILAWVKKIINY